MRVEDRRTTQPGSGARAVRMPGGSLVTRRVASEWTGGAYSLFEVEVAPHGDEPPHVQHRDDECICVLEGRFEILIENERFEASPGGMIYVPKGTLHAFGNVGEGVGRLLTIHTPGATRERLVEEAASAKGDKVDAIAALHGMEMCEESGSDSPRRGKESK